eukprot:6490677-Amphidinium_carterae.1
MTQAVINAGCGLRVVELDSPQYVVQEHGAFTVADFPVVEWQSSTTHSMYVVVVNKLDAHASLQDLVVAIEEDLDMPRLLHSSFTMHCHPMTANTAFSSPDSRQSPVRLNGSSFASSLSSVAPSLQMLSLRVTTAP